MLRLAARARGRVPAVYPRAPRPVPLLASFVEVFARSRRRGAQSTPARDPVRQRRPWCPTAVTIAALAGAGRLAHAQSTPSGTAAGTSAMGGMSAGSSGNATLVTIGSATDERARVDQLLGRDSTAGFLLRAPSVLTVVPRSAAGTLHVVPLVPEIVSAYNTAIPTSDNDGALWAGRGANVLVRGGLAARVDRVTVVVAPEIAYSQNRAFQTQPAFLTGQRPATGPFAAQWFVGPYSTDLPIRFGDQPYTVVGFGQSSISVDAGPVAAGISSENEWWGPGVRNALLLGNAAEGVPRLFVRTARPLHTRLGDVEARWILGGLTPSLYFTPTYVAAPRRALNGAVVTLRPAIEPGLTVGVARLVLSPVGDPGDILGHALDVLVRNQNLGTGDTLRTNRTSDQLASVFGRWVIPTAGTEVYGEFARLELPRSLRDFLLAPLNTGAYTLGFAQGWRQSRGAALRASIEFTNLEQSRTFTDRPPPPDYYTGRASPAGFTNRGQPLGAAVGPGSSSQSAGVDYYATGWQLGGFLQRTRNQNDALYRVFVPNPYRHDVSLTGGVRGGARLRGVDGRASLAVTERLNYLFQNGSYNALRQGSVDVRNVSLTLSLSPAPRSPR